MGIILSTTWWVGIRCVFLRQKGVWVFGVWFFLIKLFGEMVMEVWVGRK
jgi:hypothetical protein